MCDSFLEVKPIIEYPRCIQLGKIQDCLNCDLYTIGGCNSPRSKCVLEYKNHKKGCPNYGKKMSCPPIVPMFDQIFDISQPIYAIFSKYDLSSHVEKMRIRHPEWSETQLLNVLYWQGTARKNLKNKINDFNKSFREKGYYSTLLPEAMGVNVTMTLKNAGIALEWPARKVVYKVAFAGVPLSEEYLHILL